MFPIWRLKIREARVALQQGRWDEASALLGEESVRDFLPAKRLSAEVASRFVERAEQRLEQGDSVAGWSDLQQATQLGGCEEQIAQLREHQTRRGFDQVRHLLEVGETSMAKQQITRLEKHRLGGDERRAWKLIVHHITQAKEHAQQGNVTPAIELLEQVNSLLPEGNKSLQEQLHSRIAKLQEQATKLRTLSTKLHQEVAEQVWTQALSTAEAMLELAPEHQAARRARRQAWKAVGMDATKLHAGPVARKSPRRQRRSDQPVSASTHAWTSSVDVDTMTIKKESGKRVVAWIDGVGAYLLCLGDEVLLGQPSTDGADIPLLADLSRRHASLRREGEAYVLTPIHKVSVDGQPLAGPMVLTPGAIIELGDSVRMKFDRPHALSATAILSIESHHKTEPAVDGIVLMAESCIVGPQSHSHICCRKWKDDLLVFRRGDDLHIRTAADVEVDGEACGPEGVIAGNCRVEGETFAMSFEHI